MYTLMCRCTLLQISRHTWGYPDEAFHTRRGPDSSDLVAGTLGYNVQTAVAAKHHLVVAHEVANVGVNRSQLSSMAKKACAAIGIRNLTGVADRG